MAEMLKVSVPSVPAADGASAAAEVGLLGAKKEVYVTGTGFSAAVEVSENGTDWFEVAAAAAAPVKVSLDIPVEKLRVVISSYVSGTPVATVVGHL